MIEKRYCLTPEEWAYAKAELVLAEKLGLIENADIEALEKRCAEKNEENARLEMEKKVFYGPRRYSLPMYLQYELTRFRLDFVQPTENIRKSGISPEITENQKKAFYERNKDLFGRCTMISSMPCSFIYSQADEIFSSLISLRLVFCGAPV